MASINLKNVSSLFAAISYVPDSLSREGIVLISGDLGVLPDVPLSPTETDRAESITSSGARARFTAARRILRAVLCKWTSVPPLELEIITDENGKPCLITNDPIHFSITHSSDSVAIAFSRNPVGLDLECEREVDARALASRFFSTEEAGLFHGPASPGLFFKLWTCREAAIKGDGRGLSKLLGITRVTESRDGGAGSVEVLIGTDRWEAVHWKMGDDLHAALAFQEAPSLISWCDLR